MLYLSYLGIEKLALRAGCEVLPLFLFYDDCSSAGKEEIRDAVKLNKPLSCVVLRHYRRNRSAPPTNQLQSCFLTHLAVNIFTVGNYQSII